MLASLYCGLCASYGHSPAACPDTVTATYREPHFVEQLVPAAVLEEYGITTQTPLPSSRVPPLPTVPDLVWEVHETEDALRTVLLNNGVKPMICQEKGKKELRELKENKKRLLALAQERGVKIVFYGGPVVTPTKKGGSK